MKSKPFQNNNSPLLPLLLVVESAAAVFQARAAARPPFPLIVSPKARAVTPAKYE